MINSKKIQNSREGFTLIELMVSMAIVGILAATAMVNFGKNVDRDLRQEKDRFTSFLREVQNKALAGDKAGMTLGANEKICGFGFRKVGSNIESFYVSMDGLDVDCMGFQSYTKTKYDTFYPLNGTTLSLAKVAYFQVPNGDVSCESVGPTPWCAFPIAITIRKGTTTSVNVRIDQSGRIY